jgi:CDGSH-type Zn-finger protein
MSPAKITPTNNGSIHVEGEFTLCDPDGNQFDLSGRKDTWLCRCGHSNDKPFCDGSHKKMEFKSEVKARKLPPPKVKS